MRGKIYLTNRKSRFIVGRPIKDSSFSLFKVKQSRKTCKDFIEILIYEYYKQTERHLLLRFFVSILIWLLFSDTRKLRKYCILAFLYTSSEQYECMCILDVVLSSCASPPKEDRFPNITTK